MLFIPFLQAQKKGTGLIIDMPSLRGTPKKPTLTLKSYRGLPASVSLEKYCPTPGDQGDFGTCVAFASAYHMRTIMLAKQREITSRSAINDLIFSPSFVYESIKDEGDNDCQGGTNPILALELFKNLGAVSLKTVPYKCNPSLPVETLLEAIDYTISDYQILFLPDDTEYDSRVLPVKKALAEGNPVLLGITVPESFYNSGKIWTPQATDGGPSGKHGGHAVCVVGYDDNFEGGCFRIVNSWGTGWADGGFYWVRYADFVKWSLVACQAWVAPAAPPAVEPEPAPTPSPEPVPEPKPAPPAPLAVSLEGKVEFVQNTGAPMPAGRVLSRNLVVEEENDEKPYKEDLVAYRMDSDYPSGTKFRFFITTNTESYIYAFATDLATRRVNKIFPFDDLTSPHIGPNSQVAFPSETKVVKMDSQPGTDYMLILYSKEKLDINDMLSKMNASPGGLSQKIHAAVGEKMILPSEIAYKASEIGFDVRGEGHGSVVPLMVEISHK